MLKICPHCKQVKNLPEFSLNKSKRLGVQTYCKQCVSARRLFARVGLSLQTPYIRISIGDRVHYKVHRLPIGVLWKLPVHVHIMDEIFVLDADCYSDFKGRWFAYPVRGTKYVVGYRKPVLSKR